MQPEKPDGSAAPRCRGCWKHCGGAAPAPETWSNRIARAFDQNGGAERGIVDGLQAIEGRRPHHCPTPWSVEAAEQPNQQNDGNGDSNDPQQQSATQERPPRKRCRTSTLMRPARFQQKSGTRLAAGPGPNFFIARRVTQSRRSRMAIALRCRSVRNALPAMPSCGTTGRAPHGSFDRLLPFRVRSRGKTP